MVNRTPQVKDSIIKACIKTFSRQSKALKIPLYLITLSFHRTSMSRYQRKYSPTEARIHRKERVPSSHSVLYLSFA